MSVRPFSCCSVSEVCVYKYLNNYDFFSLIISIIKFSKRKMCIKLKTVFYAKLIFFNKLEVSFFVEIKYFF